MSPDNKPPRKRPNRQQPPARGGRPSPGANGSRPGRPGAKKPVAGAAGAKKRPANSQSAKSKASAKAKQATSSAKSRIAAAKAGQSGKKNKANKSRSASAGNITARTRKTERWKDSNFRRQVLAGFAALLAIAIIVPLVAFFAAYSVTKVPEPEELVNNQISYIMASDNEKELARIVPPEGNRQNVNLSEIPEPVRNAVLAAEDRNYYDNPGFSITGFGRAALGQLLGRSGAGGGSTITQQYVKNALVGDEYSLMRKAKELVISAKMAREWSKDEILEAYLNTIYFGRNAYGISSASRAYFDKDVKDLTPEEGAVLAASIQAPSMLDPWTSREAAENRWNYVMDGMQEINAISREERLSATYPEVKDPATTANTSVAEGTNGLIKSRVIAELEAAGITEDQVNTGGLRITTTIDPKNQEAAVDEYHKQKEGYQDNLLGAVVSVDPKTGAIRAWYGGDDPVGFDWAGAGLQTGSTFKMIALAAYLDQGGTIYDLFDSSPVTTGETLVENVNDQSCGTCSINEALKMSLNTSFIRLTRKLKGGAQDVADMAHRLGVAEELPGIGKTLTENGGPPFEGITLGQYQSSPLDMASALATLANEGVYHRPHFVQKVETLDGEVLLDNSNMEGDQVVPKEVANNVMAAMGPIAAYSNGNSLAGGRPSAAKTGTAQLGDTGKNKDAWMIGATPQLATAVWIGAADGAAVTNQWGGQMYGSGLPSTIWKNVMDRSLEGKDVENFGVSAAGTGTYQGSDDSAYQAPAQPQQQQQAPSSESSDTGGGDGAGGGDGNGGGADAPGQDPAPEPQPEPAPAPAPNPAPAPAPAPGLGEIIGDILG